MVISSPGPGCEILPHTTQSKVAQGCQGPTQGIPLLQLPLSPSKREDLDGEELPHPQDSYCFSLPESGVGVAFCPCTT